MSQRDELEKAVQDLKINKEILETGINEMDNLLILRYKHLQEVGFTAEESLKIILERGIS